MKPWEKYQSTEQEGPWSKYQAAPEPVSSVEMIDNRPGLSVQAEPEPSWLDVAGGAIENLPSSAGKYLGGIVEAVTHPGATIQGVADIAAGGLRKVLPDDVVRFIDQFDTNPEATKRATEVFKQVGGEYAKNYGTEAGFKKHLMTDPVSVMADLSMVTGAGAGLARKAGAPSVANALATTANVTNPLTLPITAFNKTVSLGKKAYAPVERFIDSFTDQKGKMYERAAAGNENALIRELEQYQSPIPGYKPTAAEVGAEVGGPEWAALGRSAREGPLRGEYFEKSTQNKAALGEALNRMAFRPTAGAQTPVQKMAEPSRQIGKAEQMRSATAAENYSKALDDVAVKGDEMLSVLMQRPSMDRAVEHAVNIAREKGQDFQFGTTEAKMTPINILDKSGKPIGKAENISSFAEYSGNGLHYLKMALDDMVKNPDQFGIKGTEVNAINKTRKEFVRWMEQKLPGYEKARSVFADQSKPINQMQVSKYLQEKLTSAMGDASTNLRAGSFAEAVRSAPSTIKRATDSTQRHESIMGILNPSQVKVVEDVLSELRKSDISKKKAQTARGPEFDVSQSTKYAPGEHITPSFLSSTVTTANHIWRKLRGKIDQQVAVEISLELLDPKKAAQALRETKMARDIKAYKKAPRPQSRMATTIDNALIKSLKSPISPQLMNALSAGREQPVEQ